MVPTEQLRRRADALRLRAPAARHARCRHAPVRPRVAQRNRCAPPGGVGPAARSSRCMSAASLREELGTLAAAFGAVRQAAPEARLVVVGDGPARSSCSIGCPMRCSRHNAPARTWRRTTRRRPVCRFASMTRPRQRHHRGVGQRPAGVAYQHARRAADPQRRERHARAAGRQADVPAPGRRGGARPGDWPRPWGPRRGARPASSAGPHRRAGRVGPTSALVGCEAALLARFGCARPRLAA